MRVAINGFGRIGRQVLKALMKKYSGIEIVAVNDLFDLDMLSYLLKYDSNYGVYDKDLQIKDNKLIIDGKEIIFFKEKNIENLPWKDLNIDIVIESTGVYTDGEKARFHLTAGAKKSYYYSTCKK